MFYVIALGGNALLKRGEPLEANLLKRNIQKAAQLIAKLTPTHQILIVHGNGPQVGLLALQAEAYKAVSTYPLDILDAESQGMIGYVLQQALSHHTQQRCVTVLTQVLVDANDPAFKKPSKFIGPVYPDAAFSQLQEQHPHWHLKNDGAHLRRVVPSPKPQRIWELDTIRHLLSSQTVVIAGGGGGIPCILSSNQTLQGIEAVIDKDRTAALLAEQLNADHLVILTDVDGVYSDWNKPTAKIIRDIDTQSLQNLSFPSGSMGPKVQAAIEFAQTTGRCAYIGALDELDAIIANQSGTRIVVR